MMERKRARNDTTKEVKEECDEMRRRLMMIKGEHLEITQDTREDFEYNESGCCLQPEPPAYHSLGYIEWRRRRRSTQ